MSKINFALVGCGRVAPFHFDAINNCEDANLVAVCDTLGDRATEFGEKYGVPFYASLEAMLERQDDIDVVNICTPSGLHPEHAITCLKAGLHVVTEKPMALSVEDGQRMIDTAKKTGQKLFVVFQNRFNPPIVKLRKAYEDGLFGKLVMASIRLRWMRLQEYYNADEWRGTLELDGGVLANQAIHHIDLLQWFGGEIDSAYGKISTRLLDIEAEDTGAGVLHFKNGALGVIEATSSSRPHDLEGSLSIMGEHGTVVVGGTAVNKVDEWKFTTEEATNAGGQIADDEISNVYGNGHLPYIQNVCDTLNEKCEAAVDGEEGLKAIRILCAIYESAKSGNEIKF